MFRVVVDPFRSHSIQASMCLHFILTMHCWTSTCASSNPVIVLPYTSHFRQQWRMLPESQWCEPFFSIALLLKPFHFSVSLNYCFRFPFLLIIYWFRSLQSPSIGETSDAQKNVFDLGAFVGDLTLEEDPSRFSSLSTTFSFSS